MSKITVTKEQVDDILANAEIDCKTIFGKTTVVTAKLPNGFVIVESSSCVDPANYNQDIGYEICMERIRNKVWELEGYVLQCEMTKKPTLEELGLADSHDEDRQYNSHPPLVYDSTKHGWPPPDGKDPYPDVDLADMLPSPT